ncbi:hypothetical protein C2845_PM10G01510 [Panicum miliaceum]|uniref:Aminotransferase class I/classII large domain-containing protein n=1 Tax=Panicum miliaceum TaxID=4540 RepID=A0A3L6PHW5_PANMI|nr:hypothetical protein C2845_PM10G01510 [Panicum miliaceum]
MQKSPAHWPLSSMLAIEDIQANILDDMAVCLKFRSSGASRKPANLFIQSYNRTQSYGRQRMANAKTPCWTAVADLGRLPSSPASFPPVSSPPPAAVHGGIRNRDGGWKPPPGLERKQGRSGPKEFANGSSIWIAIRALAGFMRQIMHESVSFDPSQMVITSGATPAMEILSFCIADPGNAFLVPSPYYPGWDRDIKWRTGVELIPVPCRSTDNFNISITALEIAYKQAKKRGVRVRGVLISNPSNPTGGIVPRETLHDLLEFAAEKNIHFISDEIFAGSTYGSDKFVSVAEVVDELEDFDKGRVHIIYGLSKDLSLAGFRVGVIYSYNENIVAAAAKIARFSSVSTPTQRLLVSMLSDQKFISEYLTVNRERLRKMYHLFVDALKQVGIECFKSSGGFYCWADMSRYIRSYSEKGERKLWDRLLEEAKVNVTPGSSCHCIEPGWFRCCFTALSEEDIPVLVERLRRVTDSHKSNS